jgi:plastocyanin
MTGTFHKFMQKSFSKRGIIKPYHVLILLFIVATSLFIIQALADVPTVRIVITKGAFSSQACAKNDNCFDPSIEQIMVQEAVEWKNTDTASHTATSDGVFDSGMIPPGGTFDFTFTNRGSFDYYCKVHPWMRGVVVVLSTPTPVVNATVPSPTLPVAGSGPSQVVREGDTVTLTGTGTDPYGLPLDYSWTQTSGPRVHFSNSTVEDPTFIAPSVNSTVRLSFQLIVNDGLDSYPSTTTITVQPSSPVPEFGVTTPAVLLVVTLSSILIGRRMWPRRIIVK